MNNKQVRMFCIKLNLVRTKRERKLGDKKYALKKERYEFRKHLSDAVKKEKGVQNWTKDCSELFKEKIKADKNYMQIEKNLKSIRKEIHDLYVFNQSKNRIVYAGNIKTKDIIAIGDNNLARTMGLDLGTFTDKIITVKIGDMDNLITKKIIKDGLDIINVKGEKQHYKFFTAGAGQSRQKKFMMTLDDEELDNIMLTLMNGLTIEDINAKGGMNISKFLAYLSLNNSGSTVWENFDIDKCIVVDDFETFVPATVDYIDRETEEVEYKDKLGRNRHKDVAKWTVNKGKAMDVPVPHFDGLGIMLPSVSKKNMQVRLPWLKGLLTPMDWISYNKEHEYSNIVEDIYGKEHDILKEGITVIFTKSQFKLWNFYNNTLDNNGNIIKTGWDQYKENFKKYKCTANICMEDEDKYKDMSINYQMLQQLINMDDTHIDLLTEDFKNLIKKVHTNRQSQLEFLHATLEDHRDYFEEGLRLYPEMLQSAFVKKKIKDDITKAKKDACSGKIKIKDSRRVFILSDPCAFCDWLFGHIETPEGYLKDGEVYCNLFKENEKLDVLRSPSLSFEHAIRTNMRAVTKEKYKWYITNALYTSTHDIISKILMFDVDGDEALILSTDWIIKLAEDIIKTYNIRPIYYEMNKAGAKEINMENIAESLLFVFQKSNIGKVSNKITNIWNGKNPMERYEIIQKLCAYNNDVIDSAKSLHLPKLPDDIKEALQKEKYPYFFQYAKKKKNLECKPISDSVMDRICKNIEKIKDTNTKFNYDKGFGTFRIKTLLYNQENIGINRDIIKYYLELEKTTLDKIDEYAKEFNTEDDEDMKKTNFKEMFYADARTEFLNFTKSINIKYEDAVDSIIKYTHKENNLSMSFIWNVFGAVIINNINKNIKKSLDDGYIMCEDCGKRIKRESNRQTKCKKCATKAIKERNKNRNTHLGKSV